jgi:hypothetical protein
MLKGKGTLTPIQKNLLHEIGKIREASFFSLPAALLWLSFTWGIVDPMTWFFLPPKKTY